ncbi:50S ribosomal protein L2 [Candidatus Saccharibacteria bacterium]|nr:50S ribosomal protein L2 [Candidatus Saccharibacteria bacterium]NIV03850.1 50S ribosomal protein L2 [Calditrichia bacterium]NIS38409.1 50S ribosomal protein L2 [Candidatus Saccharibacteria bacterium]NIV72185.1 50S ribosomal protein L2 [Calditrichia bacterium]NIV99098.1 50S ribosomal protein L2 [Candidatus Saccharibacteria bacterium]
MAVKKYKPTSPGRRISSVQDFSDVTKAKPEKKLTVIKKKKAGRGATGRITVRHKGGGTKRFIRVVDWQRQKYDVPARVESIEYDPNRGARIALLIYEDGAKKYMLAPVDLKIGDKVISSKKLHEIKAGNRYPLEIIPLGMPVYNIELTPGKGGQIVRGAGSSAVIMAMEGKYAQLKMPSGEIRLFPKDCMATIGQVSNPDWRLIRWGKAGRIRHKGVRPTVRGKVMNPVDHPHGGGEGASPIGLKHPKTPWGKPALGVKTRRKKASDKLILKRRASKKRKR